MRMDYFNWDEVHEYVVALRRDFHQHPEISLSELRTAGRIEEELDSLGISHQRIGKTGVLGTMKGTGSGHGVVALRADIDALPIQETSNIEYCSQTDGVMHACGHDAHTACLLGAAKILMQERAGFGGEIRLIFQPAEEIGQGIREFFDAGVMAGVKRVFGIHTASDIPAGTVGLKPGLNNASVDHFRIIVKGKSAHVSAPQLGIDALYVASQIVVLLQAIVTRRTSPVEPVIIGVGKLSSGTTYNALAESAEMEGTTRTVSVKMREEIRRQVTEVAQQTAALYGGSAEVVWTDFASPLINDPLVCKEIAFMVKQFGIEAAVSTDRELSLSGDNFADLLMAAPGTYAYLGTGNPEMPGTQNPAHNGKFDIDERALGIGVQLYAGCALGWLRT
mgnify:FL=1